MLHRAVSMGLSFCRGSLRILDAKVECSDEDRGRMLENLYKQVSPLVFLAPLKKGLSLEEMQGLRVAIDEWTSNVPTKQLDGFIKLCPETAQLVVVPPLSDTDFPRYIRVFNPSQDWSEWLGDKWNIGITDGRSAMPYEPSIHLFNPERKDRKRNTIGMLEEYQKRFAEYGLSIMPQNAYLPATIDAIYRGNPLDLMSEDEGSRTAFEGNGSDPHLPTAHSTADKNEIILSQKHIYDTYDSEVVRCRPWYGGELQVG